MKRSEAAAELLTLIPALNRGTSRFAGHYSTRFMVPTAVVQAGTYQRSTSIDTVGGGDYETTEYTYML